MYFLTVWLKKEDGPDDITFYSSIISELVKDFCRSENVLLKTSESGKRLTVTLPCDSPDYKCLQNKNTIEKLIATINQKINRVAKAKALCS